MLLRQDNADRRLSKTAYELGLLDYKYYKLVEEKERLIQGTIENLKAQKKVGKTLWQYLSDPNNSYIDLLPDSKLPADVIEQIEIDARYEAYIKRENSLVLKNKKMRNWNIPENFDYENIKGLRNEARNKLLRFKPRNLAQAARIDGVTPAEISLLQIHLEKYKRGDKICQKVNK